MHSKLAKILAPIADRKGEVLYSEARCLQPCDTYLLGYNPGQGGPDTSIGEHLNISLKRTDNAWLDESWLDGGPSRLQLRVHALFEDAGLDLRETPASNLIFAMSTDSTGVDYKLADVCWPAHQEIMQIVKPSRLIVFGNGEDSSPYGYIKSRYGGREERQRVKSRKAYVLKRWFTSIDGRPTEIIGIPHMSRFKPVPETAEWIR